VVDESGDPVLPASGTDLEDKGDPVLPPSGMDDSGGGPVLPS